MRSVSVCRGSRQAATVGAALAIPARCGLPSFPLASAEQPRFLRPTPGAGHNPAHSREPVANRPATASSRQQQPTPIPATANPPPPGPPSRFRPDAGVRHPRRPRQKAPAFAPHARRRANPAHCPAFAAHPMRPANPYPNHTARHCIKQTAAANANPRRRQATTAGAAVAIPARCRRPPSLPAPAEQP